MRLVGIALLALILVGTVIALSLLDTRSLASTLLHRIADPEHLVFSTAYENPATHRASDTHTARFLFDHDRSVILSGLPAYQSVRFQLPRDARPLSGRLHLELTAQVLPGTEAVLRVQIGGVKRAEVLLRPGTRSDAVEVELLPADLAGDALKISFSVLGKGPTGPCDGSGPLSTSVEIEPVSMLELALNAPITTARDLVARWGGVARIGWSGGLAADEQGQRLALAADLVRKGGRAVFLDAGSPEAFGTQPLRDLVTGWRKSTAPHPALSLALAEVGPNAGVRRFTRLTRWRVGVDHRDRSHSFAPDRLDLSLALGPLSAPSGWVLDVTLGGRLIHAEIVQPASGTFEKSLALPDLPLKPGTQIEVTVTSSVTKQSLCDEVPELIAEMRAASRLHFREVADSLPARLRAFLIDAGGLGIDVLGPLTAPEATEIAQILADITPPSLALQMARGMSGGISARIYSGSAIAHPWPELTSTWRLAANGAGDVTILSPGDTPPPHSMLISFEMIEEAAP
ncbi:MAG: hypothetical protein AAGD13_23520 [Pseudomonadota bacterium]